MTESLQVDQEMQMQEWTSVTNVAELERMGVPAPAVRDKVLTSFEEVHREWLAATSLVLVATSSADGRCDVSPKGDPAGFVHILGPTLLAIPDRPGNKRMDGFHNILENPHVGLICIIPGRGDTLRVNGRARLVSDGPHFDAMIVKGHRPSLAILVEVQEVFFHCPKAFRRSHLWEPDTWQPDACRPYVEIALALWRKDDPEDEVRTHYSDAVYNESLYKTP